MAIERREMNVETIAICGCPRSGTSLSMDIHRVALGDDRIYGDKWPMHKRMPTNDRREADKKRGIERETDSEWAVRKYLNKKSGRVEKALEAFTETMKMNPNGFWEMAWTVRGMKWTPHTEKKISEFVEKKGFVKIVSQGLAQSDPRFIGKVIYMLRHPRAVAKSQEELKGRFGGLDLPKRNNADVKEHSPRMFVQVTKMAAKWLDKYKTPFLIVDFDELIEDPAGQVARIKEFIGEDGNWDEAVKKVNPKLRRSHPQEIDNPLWECAEEIYEAMGRGDLEAVAKVELPKMGDREKTYPCTRLDRRTSETECKMCQSHEGTRANMIKTANKHGKDWIGEPCIYECLTNETPIDESIERNHWKATVDKMQATKDKPAPQCEHMRLTGEMVEKTCCGGGQVEKVNCASSDCVADRVARGDTPYSTRDHCKRGACRFYT